MDYGMCPTLLVDGKHGALWMMLRQNGDSWVIGTNKLSRTVCRMCDLFVFTWEVCTIIYIYICQT